MSDLPPENDSPKPAPTEVDGDASRGDGSAGQGDGLRQEGEDLIVAAFRQAYESGRGGWSRMTTAVLKNRMLTITDREFDEAKWGAETILEFAKQYGDIVAVDLTQRPPVVELRDLALAAAEARSTVDDPAKHIRRDLWDSILDFSNSDVAYILCDGRAVPVPAQDADPAMTLPTIDKSTFDRWRATFVEGIESTIAEESDRQAVQRWRDERRPDAMLPRSVRRRWNAILKQHVWNELNGWFVARGEDLPDDALIGRAPSSTTTAKRTSEALQPDSEELRSLVQGVVQRMTREELEELRLPPAALLRVRQQ